MFAITQSIAKWRQYLLGRKFTIVTDQQSLKNLTDQVIQTPDQHKWLGKLIGYDFDIVYRPGKLNNAADALSRVTSSQFIAFSQVDFDLISELKVANATHPELLSIQQRVLHDPVGAPSFIFKDGLLLYKGRLVLPSDSPLRFLLLTEFHSSPIGGHAGITRTLHRLSSNFFWQSMRKDVKTFVSTF